MCNNIRRSIVAFTNIGMSINIGISKNNRISISTTTYMMFHLRSDVCIGITFNMDTNITSSITVTTSSSVHRSMSIQFNINNSIMITNSQTFINIGTTLSINRRVLGLVSCSYTYESLYEYDISIRRSIHVILLLKIPISMLVSISFGVLLTCTLLGCVSLAASSGVEHSPKRSYLSVVRACIGGYLFSDNPGFQGGDP